MDDILIEHGNKKVKISDSGFGLELFTMRNGWQWSGQPVDDELLKMVSVVIKKYFDKKSEVNNEVL